MTADKDHDAFEAWFRESPLRYSELDVARLAWQARAALAAQPQAAPQPEAVAPLSSDELASILVFGGFTTKDAAAGFGERGETMEKIAYMARLINERMGSAAPHPTGGKQE